MSDESRIELCTVIAATPSTVFRFFTDPVRFARWVGGAMGQASIVPEPGGAVRVEFPGRVVRGEVLTLEPDARFEFSWGIEGDVSLPPGSSHVSITLTPVDRGTEVLLVHTGLPSADLADAHRGGWSVYVALLANGSSAEQNTAAGRRAAAGWFAAWADHEEASRREKLASCCAPEVEFREAWACLRGLDGLDRHVATSQMVSQGASLGLRGEPTECHGWVRFGWQACREGMVVATGENVGRLGLDGRFVEVLGFRDPATPPPT